VAAVRAIRWRKADDLFDRVGTFLSAHGLGPEPENYGFVHTILTQPDGMLATAVARITDGGVRLTRQDLARLGVDLRFGPSFDAPDAAEGQPDEQAERANALVAQTQAQVDDFASMMRVMRDETSDFGRDLAASAEEISRTNAFPGIDDIARITGTMMSRVRDAEAKLESATAEADLLREKLAEAQDNARRDPLTGLPNRRALAEAVASRASASVDCIALCDVDRFKAINDNHGHAVGDRVLVAISETLAQACGGHLVARHGGEEFAVLLLGIDLAAATAMLEKARAAIGAKRFRTRDSGTLLGRISMSVGVTTLAAAERGEDALARADRLLYAAKSSGRDQVRAG
jgi:diguanylate cyclase